MTKMDVDEDSGDEQTPDLVHVNFDYYNVNATSDYHGIQRLFIQLFGPDAERVQTGPLTDLVTTVAEESGVGSTIKIEEEEGSAPYAVLTVISCRDHAGMQTVVDYVLSKTSTDEVFHSTLSSLLQHEHVGLVLSERVVNMPVQVMGPMYRMLSEEMDEALADTFTHYLFVSRVYRAEGQVHFFHPEDEVILQHATHAMTYAFTESQVAGRVMIVPSGEFKAMVENIELLLHKQ